MKVFGLAGWSGSGKTNLVVRLVPSLVRRGLSVSTLKHAHHTFEVDQPGKDSYEHRHAGAKEVVITSRHRWALMHELRGAPEPTIEEIAPRLAPVDLLLVEGFKREDHDKLEVHRAARRRALLCNDDPRIVAIASDEPLRDVALPVIDLNDTEAIADFIVGHCGLDSAVEGAA